MAEKTTKKQEIPNYIKQILAAYQSEPSIKTPGVKMVHVYHDDDCGIFKGKPCDCNPDVVVETKPAGKKDKRR